MKKRRYIIVIAAIFSLVITGLLCYQQTMMKVKLTQKSYWKLGEIIIDDYTISEKEQIRQLMNDKEVAFHELDDKKINEINIEILEVVTVSERRLFEELKTEIMTSFDQYLVCPKGANEKEVKEYEIVLIEYQSAMQSQDRFKLKDASQKVKRLFEQYEKNIQERKKKSKNAQTDDVGENTDAKIQGYNEDLSKENEDAQSNQSSDEWEFDDPFEHGCTVWGNCSEADENPNNGSGW